MYLKGHCDYQKDTGRKTEEEIYWEHNGKVGDPVYARNMVRKINAYERNGIFPGEKLILTYETEQTILGTDKIAEMVERFLCFLGK